MEKYVTLDEYREMWIQLQASMQQLDIPPALSEIDGILLPPGTDTAVEGLKTWEVREDDAFILTYPKAGTTWVQEIMSAVMHDGNIDEVNKKHTIFRVPFLEMDIPEPIRRTKNLPEMLQIAAETPSPRVLKSHLPGHFLPPQLWKKKPKIVYVIRNPKDLTVSYFYFNKMVIPTPEKLAQPFGEFFEEMLTGKAVYGPWWDHYLYFWKMRHEENVLLLRFEDLKRDLRGNVEKISRFLGKNLPEEKLEAITEHCQFDNMKNNPMANPGYVLGQSQPAGSSKSFMRKGKVGDWKSHFTVAQNEAFDAFIQDKLRGTGMTFDYD